MDFKTAYDLPIGNHVEKKGKFGYLSWAYGVKYLRENFPEATWQVGENEHGLPVFMMGENAFVKVTVSLGDKHYTQWHPVLDNRNNPIKNPSSFEVNTSIQRCLAKAIGIATGIGLGLYVGEDLPTEDAPAKEQKAEPWKDTVLGDKCSEYNSQADKCASSVDLAEWWDQNNIKAKEELGDYWFDRHKKYVGDIGKVMKESEAKLAGKGK